MGLHVLFRLVIENKALRFSLLGLQLDAGILHVLERNKQGIFPYKNDKEF